MFYHVRNVRIIPCHYRWRRRTVQSITSQGCTCVVRFRHLSIFHLSCDTILCVGDSAYSRILVKNKTKRLKHFYLRFIRIRFILISKSEEDGPLGCLPFTFLRAVSSCQMRRTNQRSSSPSERSMRKEATVLQTKKDPLCVSEGMYVCDWCGSYNRGFDLVHAES